MAAGGFSALKLRLGRDRLADDLAAIEAVRTAVGADIKLMVDFNQGLSLGDALHRCHALDEHGLYWFEEPIAYNNLAGYVQLSSELATPVQLGENFYGPRSLHQALTIEAGDYVMPDLMRGRSPEASRNGGGCSLAGAGRQAVTSVVTAAGGGCPSSSPADAAGICGPTPTGGSTPPQENGKVTIGGAKCDRLR